MAQVIDISNKELGQQLGAGEKHGLGQELMRLEGGQKPSTAADL